MDMDHQNNDDDLNTNDGIPEGIPKPEKFVDKVNLLVMKEIK